MKINIIQKGEVQFQGVFQDAKVSKVAQDFGFTGKFGEIFVDKECILVGLGDKEEITYDKARKLMGKVIATTQRKKWTSFSTDIPHLISHLDATLLGRAISEGLLLSSYSFDKYLGKERKEKKKQIKEAKIVWAGEKEFITGLKQGRIIADSTNFVRDLVNEPANVLNSNTLEKAARNNAATSSKLHVKVLQKPELKRLGMGALLGVNAGSENPPKLILIEYKSGKGKWTALCGKGITFDSGGYNIKPTKYIETMKTDMGGAGAVLGTMKSIAALGIKRNVVGVLAVCENMVDAKAQRPGDIVKAYNGKTIEIGNTDAEGRLVLADALAYTQERYKPEVMVDLATLTGAVVVALGYYASGMVGKDNDLQDLLFKAGMSSGDKVWKLPFFEEYQDWMDGTISDLNNIGQKGAGWEAGSVTAGVFLSKFVDTEKTNWVHLDIAGSARMGVAGDYLSKGPSGAGVRVLSYYFMGE